MENLIPMGVVQSSPPQKEQQHPEYEKVVVWVSPQVWFRYPSKTTPQGGHTPADSISKPFPFGVFCPEYKRLICKQSADYAGFLFLWERFPGFFVWECCGSFCGGVEL
ncbi:hypothetical protein AVEN_96470-1 [Araneus ventricosus]|uniref:Uncharacterized protein n=1 Tax=Araneus ventricosus TaxID=182803 RepID=A0A4Y2CVU6_ARAVE|nr:hypothetical protein AVEN_96470-1 [Araneus ventricosus]